MKCFDKNEISLIFSEQKWLAARHSKQIRVIKFFINEISKELGLISKPRLVFVKDLQSIGNYNSQKNILSLSRSIALEGEQVSIRVISLEGKQIVTEKSRRPRPNSNTETLFTICHELEHAAQYQRIAGKIPWSVHDDRSPYINGMADAKNCYELYWLQPAEYGANQSAICELNILMEKYGYLCSENEKDIVEKTVMALKDSVNTVPDLQEQYQSSNIVRDISHCLQNLFTGRRYPVPSDLMRDVENACRSSYRYIYSEQYMQREVLLKKEINHELAKQECER